MKKMYEESNIQDIANAIREKNGSTETYKPNEMGNAIRGIDEYYKTAIYNMADLEFAWSGTVFPENTELVLRFKKPDNNQNACFMVSKNLKTLRLISDDKSFAISLNQFCRDCEDLELLDFTDYNLEMSSIFMFVYGCTKLKTILGALDLTNCTNTTNAFSMQSTVLEDVEFKPNTIKINISFAQCYALSSVSIQSIIDGLADLTGQTSQTVTFYSTIKINLTDEQLLQITSKNWKLG